MVEKIQVYKITKKGDFLSDYGKKTIQKLTENI